MDQAIALILGTAHGERPMRPEFGCGVHDYVFDTVDAATVGQIETEIREALEQQKALNELRTRFVAMTSHEFRTPLAAILSFEMALRWSLKQVEAADALLAAVKKTLDQGAKTKDLGGALSTVQMGDAVISNL